MCSRAPGGGEGELLPVGSAVTQWWGHTPVPPLTSIMAFGELLLLAQPGLMPALQSACERDRVQYVKCQPHSKK